jgi:hypothetical protein
MIKIALPEIDKAVGLDIYVAGKQALLTLLSTPCLIISFTVHY